MPRFVLDTSFFASESVTVASLDIVEVGQLSTRRPGEGSVISYGAYAGDLNDDGWSDLAILNDAANDLRVFLNDGTGQYDDFAVHPLPSGSVPSTNEGGDFNASGTSVSRPLTLTQ